MALPVVSDRDPATNAEDTAVARFRLRSGCEGVLHQSAGMWGRRVEVVRISGPKGSLSVEGSEVTFADGAGTSTVERFGPELPDDRTTQDGSTGAGPQFEMRPAIVQAQILRHLIVDGKPEYDAVPPATFADGLACVEVIEAMRHSAGNGGATVAVA